MARKNVLPQVDPRQAWIDLRNELDKLSAEELVERWQTCLASEQHEFYDREANITVGGLQFEIEGRLIPLGLFVPA